MIIADFLVLALIAVCLGLAIDRWLINRRFARIDEMIDRFSDLFPYNPNDP
ncbi:MAG: hypothetical protein MJH10_09600 [Epibacterium sp.]|nr:hypothetical protein [Epibacterium sp.]NQX73789.1 hypothetical protein [Epibacterium sp.]